MPDSPPSDTPPSPAAAAIPVVDLSRWDGPGRPALVADLREVCHEIGFLYLVGHGLPEGLVSDYFAAVQAFFDLPEQVKARVDKRLSPHFRGWERVGAELTLGEVDHREQLDLSTEHPVRPEPVAEPYLRLDGPNQWLPDEDAPGLRAVTDAVVEHLERIGGVLLRALPLGLGLPEDVLVERFGRRTFSLLKMISYPPTPPGGAGVNAHSDQGFITLLMQHGVPGLQVRLADGWVDADPPAGALIVNLGETLQAMTSGYFVATDHRVYAQEPRLSSAYFYGPQLETSLEPLPLDERLLAQVDPARAQYMAGARSGTFGESLWAYYSRSYPQNMAAHHPPQP